MPASVYQNDTGKPFEWALQYSDLSIPDLSGLTNPNFAVSFYNGTSSTGGTGTFSVFGDPKKGIVHYQQLAAEVATVAASITPFVTVTFPNGPVTFSGDFFAIVAKH